MRLLRAVAALAGLAVIAWLVWEVGPAAVLDRVRELSWRLPLLLLPHALVALLDATGWRFAFPGRLPAFPVLVGARLAGEAVNVTTPTGTLGGEPLKAWLLTRARIPFEEGLVSVVVAKTALVVSHLAFLVLALGLAARWVRPAPALLTAMGILAAVGGVAIGGFVWAQQRGLFGASGRALRWLGIGGQAAQHLARLDDHLAVYYGGRRSRFALSALFYFLGWLAGSVEVWLALGFLGSPIDFATALVIEAFGTAIRAATFLVPASLGIQEGGYVGIFVALGLNAGTGLAFGLIRRMREAVWTAGGYAILVAWRGPRGAVPGPGV